MPVPWPAKSRGCRIAPVENRAITIQQLRDLRTFLQRLCKNGLLGRQAFSGKEVKWFNISMYDITSKVVKPVITWIEKISMDGETYSWTELVACKEQPPRVLISHFWGGAFRDFMSAVDKIARANGFSATTTIWVCTFANNQFGEHFGPCLKESPFCKAVEKAESTVLVVDRSGGSLERIWCCLELYFTMQFKNTLQIFTASGRVGSNEVTSGPLVEALQNYDIKMAEASFPGHRRQILNFFAAQEDEQEVREKDGLMLDKNGNIVVQEGGHIPLSDVTLTAGPRTRRTGEKEFDHEATLFQRRAEKFEHFNGIIRSQATQATSLLHQTRKSVASLQSVDIQMPQDRGVTLQQFRIFVQRVKKWMSEEGHSWNKMQVCEVVYKFVKPRTSSKESYCSYMEVLADGVQNPQFLIDHSWDAVFCDLVASVEWLADARKLSDSTVIWIDVLSIRQHKVGDDSTQFSLKILRNIIDDCDGMLCTWRNSMREISRSYRFASIQMCMERAKQVDFGCPSGALACTSPFPEGGWEFGHFDADIARKLVQVDCRRAQSHDAGVREQVLDYIENCPGGADSFNDRFHRMSAGPVLRDAAKYPHKLADVRKICEIPGINLKSNSLNGSLGETAAHIAAASGNAKALQILLDLKCDPNKEDHIRETPLHYAAFCGNVVSVYMLLKSGASARNESAFTETPLLVAKENPAEFLGVNTEKVRTLLSVWLDAETTEQVITHTDDQEPAPQKEEDVSSDLILLLKQFDGCENAQTICNTLSHLNPNPKWELLLNGFQHEIGLDATGSDFVKWLCPTPMPKRKSG